MKPQTIAYIHSLQAELATGSQLALKQLYDAFGERLLHFAFAVIHNKQLAEEIVADVFIQVWQKRERLAGIDNLTWYLYVTTKHISLNYLRSERRQKHFDIDAVMLPYYVIEPSAVNNLASAELLQQVTKAINLLPPKCRLIFKLIKEDGLSHKKVAALLNLSLKTIENQMGVALKKIYTALQVNMPPNTIKQKR